MEDHGIPWLSDHHFHLGLKWSVWAFISACLGEFKQERLNQK